MHFTYKPPNGFLEQGDLLQRSPEIDALLEEVHPHYFRHADYKYLLILTQSCDLVIREGETTCKSRYITVAAARSLKTLLQRKLAEHQRSPRERRLRYCSAENREQIRQFVERLLNNNEPNFFYLHNDFELKIREPLVAFLALSISIKSSLHYTTCVEARVARLDPSFQNKLGWLVGNMYSRIGTPDWVPDGGFTKDEFNTQVDSLVSGLCTWVNPRHMKKISDEEKRRKQTEGEEYQLSQSDLEGLLNTFEGERKLKKEQTIDRVVATLDDLQASVDREKLRMRLRNDSTFSENIR